MRTIVLSYYLENNQTFGQSAVNPDYFRCTIVGSWASSRLQIYFRINFNELKLLTMALYLYRKKNVQNYVKYVKHFFSIAKLFITTQYIIHFQKWLAIDTFLVATIRIQETILQTSKRQDLLSISTYPFEKRNLGRQFFKNSSRTPIRIPIAGYAI